MAATCDASPPRSWRRRSGGSASGAATSRSRMKPSTSASCGASPTTYSAFVASITRISAAGTVRDGSTGAALARSGDSFAATSAATAARIGTIFPVRGGGSSSRACATAFS
ncbi:MAG: hypothetical protein LW806_03210 [Planctomycetaceae bacterium]|nr:hypothetical protein [Planctomycetaceae bacterium]